MLFYGGLILLTQFKYIQHIVIPVGQMGEGGGRLAADLSVALRS